DAVEQRLQGRTDAPRARVGLERHAEAFLEPPRRARGVNAGGAQVVGADALLAAFGEIEQLARPLRRRARELERPAAQARPEAGAQRVARVFEELDVLRARRLRAAPGPAEDPGRAHAREEGAVVGRVAL